jgi:hypothetical protein
MSRIEMNSHWSVEFFKSDHFTSLSSSSIIEKSHIQVIMFRSLSASSNTMLDSFSITFISSHNSHSNSNSNSSRFESDMSNYETLFDNDLNIEKADHFLLNKYVIYRVSQYMILDIENYDLWIFIQTNFVQFTENHLKLLKESIWKSLLDYCYSHDYWVNHDSLRKMSANFFKILNIDCEYSNQWTTEQIRWIEYNYRMLFRNIQQRKQKFANIITSEIITAYSNLRLELFQDARFQILQFSQNVQISNVQISSRQSFRDFHYSQISSS